MNKEIHCVLDIAFIISGTFLMAFSISNILEPSELVTGGISGIGIILKQYTQQLVTWLPNGIPLWFTTIILNIPLFFLAYHFRGGSFLKRTFLGVVFLTVFLALMPKVSIVTTDGVINAVFGGLIEGIGMGLVFRAMSSTGGSDLIASILIVKFPFLTVPLITAGVDGIIVVAGMISFGVEKGLYAIVAIYAMEKSADLILKGFSYNVAVYIISPLYNEIGGLIDERLKRGVTQIQAKGRFRQVDSSMLLCVINRRQLAYMKEIIQYVDKNAFVIVTDTREILGEGFDYFE